MAQDPAMQEVLQRRNERFNDKNAAAGAATAASSSDAHGGQELHPGARRGAPQGDHEDPAEPDEQSSSSSSSGDSNDGGDNDHDMLIEEEDSRDEPEAKRRRLDALRKDFLKSDRIKGILAALNNKYAETPRQGVGFPVKGVVPRGGFRVDVAEVYSPPRMTDMAQKLSMRPGSVIDLRATDEDGRPYDLSRPEVRARVIKKIREEKPWLVVLSAPCTEFSTLQAWNVSKRDPIEAKKKLDEAIDHVRFAVKLCELQHEAGRRFVYEHPVSATSWQLQCVRNLQSISGVEKVTFDFCMLGMEATDSKGTAPAKKRTTILTNSPNIADALRPRQCDRSHRHVKLVGGKAKKCEVYPEQFCWEVLVASAADQKENGKKLHHIFDITEDMEKIMQVIPQGPSQPSPHDAEQQDAHDCLYDNVHFFDDLTGHKLEKERAIAARKLEIEFFRKMGVYTKVPRGEAVGGGHKIISTRWLDVNKGDEARPDYRSRLVGREINTHSRLDLFAATPPLESLRMICSLCASRQGGPEPYVLMSIDVKRAYFHAKATRPIYIEIPIEDYQEGDERRVGRLNLSLYGTRDAAQNWYKEYSSFLESLQFKRGVASPCNFVHEQRQIYLTVHGDDFTATGPKSQMEWLRNKMAARYEIKHTMVGPSRELAKEARILNRTIRWSQEGVQYEADSRHAEIVISEMLPQGAKPVATPYTSHGCSDRENSAELSRDEARKYRGLAARLNFLALDRPDLQNAARSVAKHMASPRAADWFLLKRVARYLVGAPRCVQTFSWQELPLTVITYGDSDWAGKEQGRKSTSGGVVTLGAHMLKTWSSQQQIIALSSGEAELYALVKAAAQTKGIMAMLADFGISVSGMVLTDASAALGMVHRQGLGRTRHIDVQYLWVQQEVLSQRLQVQKVGTRENVADFLTKDVPDKVLSKHLETLELHRTAVVDEGSLRVGQFSLHQHIPRRELGFRDSQFERGCGECGVCRDLVFQPLRLAQVQRSSVQVSVRKVSNVQAVNNTPTLRGI